MNEEAETDSGTDQGNWSASELVLLNLIHAGNLERVETEAKRFLAQDPGDSSAHFYLTLALIDLKKFSEAKSHLDHLLSSEPESVRPHIAAVCLHGARANWSLVRRHVAEGLRIDPDVAFFYRYAAIADLREMKFAGAKRHIARARDLDPDDADIANLYIRIHGLSETSMTDALRRLDEYRAALRLDPHNASLHDSIGDVYLDELDDPGEAEKHYREALRLDPGDRDYQRDLFNAVAKRSLIYRLFSIPSRTFIWLGHLATAIRFQPWRLIFLVIGIKVVLAFLAWLVVVTALLWPGGKVYEWLLVSEIKRGSAASIDELRAWYWVRRWPIWVRFSLFLAVNLGFWGGLFALLGVSLAAGYLTVAIVAGVHLLVVAVLWGFRRIRANSASRSAERRRKGPPPLPRSGSI
ncbi:MAG: hypothetical protein KDL87_04635 [Verrucomicrobiae bacterium]|nr:hypothetical protein [Verrucomicrobiae bacterium]